MGQNLGIFFYVFETKIKKVLYQQRLHLLEQKYNKKSNIL